MSFEAKEFGAEVLVDSETWIAHCLEGVGEILLQLVAATVVAKNSQSDLQAYTYSPTESDYTYRNTGKYHTGHTAYVYSVNGGCRNVLLIMCLLLCVILNSETYPRISPPPSSGLRRVGTS